MINIRCFEKSDTNDVINLVLHCQNDGTRPEKSVKDQPELLQIEEKFIGSGGGFWVAMDGEKLAGCIGLINAGNSVGILKKFFVYEAYRGMPVHLGQRLYSCLMDFSSQLHIHVIILDTPKNTVRAHTFYEKAGFKKIEATDLPIEYDYPYAQCDFFTLTL